MRLHLWVALLSATTPSWLSLLTASGASLAVGEVVGRAVVLCVGVSAAMAALRRRLLVSPTLSCPSFPALQASPCRLLPCCCSCRSPQARQVWEWA